MTVDLLLNVYNTQVVERKGIEVNFKRSLVEVKPDKREAVFQVLEEDTKETYSVSTAASFISHAPCRTGKVWSHTLQTSSCHHDKTLLRTNEICIFVGCMSWSSEYMQMSASLVDNSMVIV